MSSDTTSHNSLQQHVASKSQSLVENLRREAQETATHGWHAFASLSWLWPIRGILFSIMHPQIILSVRHALLKSLVASAVIFGVLAFFTFLPQMAILAIFTGPLAPIIALIVVGAESILLISFFGRALFLEPALTHVFDATLAAQGQSQLVKQGKTRLQSSAARNVGSALVKPLQAFSRDGMVRYLLTLPLNMIPAVGTVLFLLYNGHNSGPGWHSHYFELKNMSKDQRAAFVENRRAEYTAFGIAVQLHTSRGAPLQLHEYRRGRPLGRAVGSASEPHRRSGFARSEEDAVRSRVSTSSTSRRSRNALICEL